MHPLSTALLSSGSIIDLDVTFFIQLAVFGVAYALLKWLVFDPAMNLIEARHDATEGARAEARKTEAEVKEKEAEFEAKMREVRLEAGGERDKIRAEATELERSLMDKVRNETQSLMDDANGALRKEQSRLEGDLGDAIPNLANDIVGKLLGREAQ